MGKKIKTIVVKPWERADKCLDTWKSKSELRKLKLMPHPRAIPRALVDRKIGRSDQSYYLYDIEKTVPYKESSKTKELRKSRRERLSCPKCGEYIGRAYKQIMSEYGHCKKCEDKRIEEWKVSLRNYDPTKIIVYDTETTGLSAGYDEIIQFSACDGNGNVLMNQYFKPEKHTKWPNAEMVNGISPEMVADKPPIKEFIKEIQSLFDKAELLVSYNGDFDDKFLCLAGINFKEKKYFDVMEEFAKIYGDWDYRRKSYRWQSLSTCAHYYGYSFKAHDASQDILATLHCFNKMIGKGEE